MSIAFINNVQNTKELESKLNTIVKSNDIVVFEEIDEFISDSIEKKKYYDRIVISSNSVNVDSEESTFELLKEYIESESPSLEIIFMIKKAESITRANNFNKYFNSPLYTAALVEERTPATVIKQLCSSPVSEIKATFSVDKEELLHKKLKVKNSNTSKPKKPKKKGSILQKLIGTRGTARQELEEVQQDRVFVAQDISDVLADEKESDYKTTYTPLAVDVNGTIIKGKKEDSSKGEELAMLAEDLLSDNSSLADTLVPEPVQSQSNNESVEDDDGFTPLSNVVGNFDFSSYGGAHAQTTQIDENFFEEAPNPTPTSSESFSEIVSSTVENSSLITAEKTANPTIKFSKISTSSVVSLVIGDSSHILIKSLLEGETGLCVMETPYMKHSYAEEIKDKISDSGLEGFNIVGLNAFLFNQDVDHIVDYIGSIQDYKIIVHLDAVDYSNIATKLKERGIEFATLVGFSGNLESMKSQMVYLDSLDYDTADRIRNSTVLVGSSLSREASQTIKDAVFSRINWGVLV